MFNNNHQALSVVVILTFAFILMSTLAVVAVFYVRRWQRRVRFFAHARLNENVEEITNPIFDFSATDRDDINLPVTNISSSDEKVRIYYLVKILFTNFKMFRETFQIRYTNQCTHHPIKDSCLLRRNLMTKKRVKMSFCKLKMKLMFKCTKLVQIVSMAKDILNFIFFYKLVLTFVCAKMLNFKIV
jgi:hypothetical protein